MKKLLALVLCAVLLTSCSLVKNNENGGTRSHEVKERRQHKVADYGTGDVTYTAEISDGKGTVVLDVRRNGGISSATVKSPEELAGTVITDDTEGMRVFLDGGCELPLSAEASAGLAAVFALYLPLPDGTAVTDGGEAEFTSNGYTVKLKLTENGYPATAVISKDGAVRTVKISE